MSLTSRCNSSYVSYLRRAFLVRAHPDRFPSESHEFRKRQEKVIQALMERLTASDFASYISSSDKLVAFPQEKIGSFTFHLERRNGTLEKCSLNLDENVENILSSMAKSLKSTGLHVDEPPKQSPKLKKMNDRNFWNRFRPDDTSPVKGRRGRDLIEFLKGIDTKEITTRRLSRVDASTAALIARQAFKFQAIDGTGLGWSSSSLAKCLNALTKTHQEHQEKFKVQSFYPLRLIVSNDEFQNKLDLFGGVLRLNPGSTQEQWVEILMSITPQDLELLDYNRSKLKANLHFVQDSLNVKIRKGHSCSSREYHEILLHLSNCLQSYKSSSDESSTSLTLNGVNVVIETAQSGRRPKVTQDGLISISASMSTNDILNALSSLRYTARKKAEKLEEENKQVNELKSIVQRDLLMTKIFKSGLPKVNNSDYLTCLSKLLNLDSAKKKEIRPFLAGQSLGIIREGHFCHLGDDGSLLIPSDFDD